ncbi:eukaryotic translation elongation factor 1 epsilon-1 isoform X1 [Anabrus simplex]|uniref:eukaryotic translation elongation factor 1 epsilon-1 isoform X1 n=1 Tax=Anabrus simplex TaxID=316456 RepID=UPI0034DD862C
MVVCNEKCVRQIGQYLNVPVGKLSCDASGKISVTTGPNNEDKIIGFATIIAQLARASNRPQFGNDKEDEALVRQWLEYAVCYGNSSHCSQTAHKVLKELNDVLSTRVYFVGNSPTLADIVLYHVLYPVMMTLSFQEKEQYIHVSRWFNHIQQDSNLRQKNNLVIFNRTLLYS